MTKRIVNRIIHARSNFIAQFNREPTDLFLGEREIEAFAKLIKDQSELSYDGTNATVNIRLKPYHLGMIFGMRVVPVKVAQYLEVGLLKDDE